MVGFGLDNVEMGRQIAPLVVALSLPYVICAVARTICSVFRNS